MDNFLDEFFSSSSWSDVNAAERSSWGRKESAATNDLIPDSMGACKGVEHKSPEILIPSTQAVESIVRQDTSVLLGGQSSSLHVESELRQGGLDHENKTSLLGCMDGNSKVGYMGPQSDTSKSTLWALSHGPSELLPAAAGPVKSPSLQPESGSVGSNDCEQSEFRPTLRDSHSLTSVLQLWPPSSYGAVSSLSPVIGQDELQGFGLRGQYLDTGATVLGNEYLGDENISRSNLYASLSGQDELNNHCLSSFTAGHHIPLGRTAELHSQPLLSQLREGNPVKHFLESSTSQLPHAPATTGGNCDGAVKPRVRARRGQATDPHSIAERLRREKIAERMKNLQKLVPNCNKTDKASMLDEIVEYVKFLQLQVKVLSMSRLGAAGAVVPLITDNQVEGSAGLLVSQPTDEGAGPPSESPDNLAFEQEVAKLMESNVMMAMQFLQSKGVCLMPMALASAISCRKASSTGSISSERKKPILINGLLHHNNGPPSIGIGQMSSDGDVFTSTENLAGTCNREDISDSGCNGDGAVIKQEEAENNGYNTTREMTPMHS